MMNNEQMSQEKVAPEQSTQEKFSNIWKYRSEDKGANFFRIPATRIIALIIMDVMTALFASFMALFLRFEFSFNAIKDSVYMERYEHVLLPLLISMVFFYFVWRLYKSVWRYAGSTEMVNILLATICISVVLVVYALVRGETMPKSWYIMYWIFQTALTLLVRFSYRIARMLVQRRKGLGFPEGEISNVMIIGAGAAGNMILQEIKSSGYLRLNPKCFIDDNPGCHGKYLRGVPIVGGRDKIPAMVEKYEIDEIIFAIPSANAHVKQAIFSICKETGCKMRTLPGMYQLINGDVSVAKLKEVEIEDLLGRDPVEINSEEVLASHKGKVVMVTGGGGSIGSELCRQIAQHEPKQLIIVDIYENNAYDIQQELWRKYPELNLVVLIASVRNTKRMEQIFETYHPEIVYHAAAHKHVPLMEDSPNEAIKNNVMGTYKVACAADKYGVEKFVLISTDKAVNPTNVMGASKRICEMVIQTMNNRSKTNFVAVRFGNVLGSNGSVIPLFKEQIAEGGPVTVTDPNIIRYFMTITEAVSLVLQAGAYAKGGEIFVLDMGAPVRILDLAENLIKLSGYKVGEDIEIRFTGLRPGEKMYEELLMDEEGLKDTANKMIHIGNPIVFDETNFLEQVEHLYEVAQSEQGDIRAEIQKIVPTYHYSQN